ncbi:MAG: hypothetical protein HC896_10825 [Bacteroidales bacterium]|nr:hypothetical protein [Bacteroidales bacterium]
MYYAKLPQAVTGHTFRPNLFPGFYLIEVINGQEAYRQKLIISTQ